MQKGNAAVAMVLLALVGCGKRDGWRHQREAVVREMGETMPLIDGNNQFAFDLYAKLREKPTENLFFSPYSISTALAMAYAGARGITEKEMAQALHFSMPQDRLHPAFASVTAKLRGNEEGCRLHIASRLWGQQGQDFLPEFLRITREDYGAELASLEFKNEEEARRTINSWVEEQTEKKIRELVSPGVLNPASRLVLTNAVYFLAAWEHPFAFAFTETAPFKLARSKTVRAPMMHQKEGCYGDYGVTEDAQILQLPYTKNAWSMVIILPKSVDGLADLERQLTFAEVQKWLSALRRREVEVWLPKFKFTSQFCLGEELKALGMSSAFSEKGDADFSGMDGTRFFSIGAVIHRAFVDVNEKGTEAAAATAVFMESISIEPPRPEPPKFRADHPFLFFITSNKTGAILFMGRVRNPMASEETPRGTAF